MSDVRRKIIFDASMNIAQVKTAIENIQQAMANTTLPKGVGTNFERTLTKLGTEIARFEQQAAQGINSAADFKSLESSGNKIITLFRDLQVYAKQLGSGSNLEKMIPPSMVENINKAKAAFKTYEAEIRKSEKAVKKQESSITSLTNKITDLEKDMAQVAGKKIVSSAEFTKLKKEAASASDTVGQLEAKLADLNQQKALKESTLASPNKSSSYRALLTEISQVEQQLNQTRAAHSNLQAQLANTSTYDKQQAELAELGQKLDKARAELTEMQQALQAMQQNSTFQALQTLLNVLKQIPGLDMSQFSNSAEGAAQAVQHLISQGLGQAKQQVDGISSSMGQANPIITTFGNNMRQAGQSIQTFFDRTREMDMLKYQIQYFFGITNVINLFRRAVTSAFNTVKELDAAMTEIAVVSKFDVSDMWSKLPEFTDQANQLGVAVKEAYSGTTLFVQQGLDLESSMALSTETLKMARIAGMDAAEATDAMTAALRGFNMELNETSAERVNDVYSKLAAITASNTQEISTAMTKTASIAHNANMEFETTAAFLSQIIETTRESAETAGTAMKTVIARFQELKKDPSEIGEVEGEVVDANKIETALRTIGVSLRDASGQFRALDEVFLEIASKWDDLDTNTQRYIATMAAGSRQQSRFIAMMSDYDRTMQLVDAANNSAGASQQQFEKTLESLESKLARLKNAWNEFTMGIANSEVIKVGVDILTTLLETVNKIASGFGDIGGAIVKLATAFAVIKGGRALFSGLFSGTLGASLMGDAGAAGAKAGMTFGQNFAHKLKTTKLHKNSEVGKNLFKSFFTDTSSMALPKNLMNKPLSEMFNSIDPSNIDTTAVKNLMTDTLNAVDPKTVKGGVAEVQRLQAALNNADPSQLQKINAEMEEAGIQAKTTEGLTTGAAKKMTADWKAVGGAIAGAGMALMFFGNQLADAGFEKLGKTISKLGTSLMGIGMILSITLPLQAKAGAEGVSLAIKSIPIIGWIAAIVSALITLGSIVSDFIETSAERSKRLASEADAARAAAESAKDAYEELLHTFEEYDTAQQALEDLTRGTEEWRQALIDVNNQVIELLQLYPDLAKYVERGTEGQLAISSEGRAALLKKQEEGVVNLQQASLGAEMYQAANNWQTEQLEFESLLGFDSVLKERLLTLYRKDPGELFKIEDRDFTGQELVNLYKSGQKESAEGIWKSAGLDQSYGRSLEEMISSGIYGEDWLAENIDGLIRYSDALNQIANDSNYSASYLYYLRDSIAAYSGKELANELQMTGYATSALALDASDALASSQYATQIEEAFAQTINTDSFLKDVEKRAKSYKRKNSKAELEKLYLSKTGLNKLPQELEEGGENAIASALAKMDSLSGVADVMNEFYSKFVGFEDNQKEQVLKLIQKDGKGFTHNIIDAYSEAYSLDEYGETESINVEQIKGIFETQTGLALTDIAELMGMEVDAFARMLIENAEMANDAYEDALSKVSNFGLSLDGIVGKDISSGALSGLVDHLYQVAITGSVPAARALTEEFSAIISGMDSETAEKFVGALNLIDWSSIDSIEDFSDLLKEFDINTGLTDEQITQLELRMIELAGATKNLNFDNLKEELKSTQELIDDIQGREANDLTFSDDQRKIMIESGISEDQFVLKGVDEWVYIGGSLESILTSINGTTEAILGKMGEELDAAVARGALFAAAGERGTWAVRDDDKNPITEELTDLQFIEGLISDRFTYAIENEDGTYTLQDPNAEMSISEDNLKILAEGVGVDTEDKTSQQIIEALKLAYAADWGAGGVIYQENLTKQQQWATDSEQMRLYQMSSAQDMLAADASDEVKDEVFQAIMAEENLEGIYQDAVEGLEAAGEELDEYDKALLKALVIDSKLAAKRIDELNGAVSENKDALKNASKTSFAYKEALSKVTKTAKKVFGDHITEDFVEQYIDDFLKLEQGGEVAQEAFNKIGEAAGQKLLDDLNLSADALRQIGELTTQLDGLNLEIGSTADFSNTFNQLATLMGDASKAAEYLRSLGYTVEFEQVGTTEMQVGFDGTIINGVLANPTVHTEPIPIYEAKVTKNDSNGTSAPSGGGGGGGGGGGDNDIDKHYNLSQDISSSLREREKLERRYNRLIESRAATGVELQELSKQELENLENQKKLQEQMLKLRKQERQDIINENGQYSEYVKYNEEDNTIEINWEAIDALSKDKADEFEEVSEFISDLEEVQGKIEDVEDALWDIQESVDEIRERGKESYIDLEGRVVEALIEEQNKIIEGQEKINESINDAASDLMDAIQSSIDKLRQDRENEKTEESLSEKERRLAYLRQDTSGANAMEIKKLEEELANEREAYSDTLVDQALQDLQEQNDDAAEQRERQIKLLQDQLDWAEKTGAYNAKAKEILEKGILNGTLSTDSELYKLLHAAENAGAMTEVTYLEWLKDLRAAVAESYNYQQTIQEEDNTDYMALMQERFASNGGIVDDQILAWNAKRNEKIDRNPELAIYGTYTPKELEAFLKKNVVVHKETAPADSGKGLLSSLPSSQVLNKTQIENLQKGLNDLIKDGKMAGPALTVDGNYGPATTAAVRRLQSAVGASPDGLWGPKTREKLLASSLKHYKTGGLADFTGPAWLDGTKSRPEMVLNAQDTENFLVLKDILSSLLHLPTIENTSGDNYFDISIQVEEISDDYDVDQMVERVKQKIYEDSMYRNNNSINLLR